MYRKTILIVKTSSLGDIVQAFGVLNDLRRRFPDCEIDWAVEKPFLSIASAHPLIRRAIPLDRRNLLRSWKELRKSRYDLVFDLQGNIKSGVVTLFSRGQTKVGFGFQSAREWPNILATHKRFNVPKNLNIRLQHLQLLAQFFQDTPSEEIEGVRFRIDQAEESRVEKILAPFQGRTKIMVCPGSKWINKQLPFETWISFLTELEGVFLFVWGNEEEKLLCQRMQAQFPDRSSVIDRLSLPVWQNLMSRVDRVIAVDSSALHLCGTTSTPSFSLFGPTSPNIFKPIGARHTAIQGACPYGRTFEKQCPVLRTCPTGACIRHLTPEQILKKCSRSKD